MPTHPSDDDRVPPAGCSVALAWHGAPASADGAVLPLSVTVAGCPDWTAAADVPWMSFDSASDVVPFGRGNGTVVVRVASNPAARRRGSATVAWTRISIDQAGVGGSGCTVQVTPPSREFTGGTAATGTFIVSPSAPDCGWIAVMSSVHENVVRFTDDGAGGAGGAVDYQFGIGPAAVAYSVTANGPTSPWITAPISIHDSARVRHATHQVVLTPGGGGPP